MNNISNDDSALAAEYVLGLLDPGSQAQAAARVTTDTGFAAEVAAWEERLMPFLGSEVVMPPAALWSAIEAKTLPVIAQDRAPAGVRLWQGMTAISTSVAAALALMLYSQPPASIIAPPTAQATPLLAALGSESGTAAVAVSFDKATGMLILTPVSLKTGALFPELWVIPADGVPRSLGIIKAGAPSRQPLDPALQKLLASGVTLAITPEPAKGSPTGQPTGAIIASGKVTSL